MKEWDSYRESNLIEDNLDESEEVEVSDGEMGDSIIDYNDCDLNLEDVVDGENNLMIIETMEKHYIKYAKTLEDKLKDASSKMVITIVIKANSYLVF